jgi:hypothetical protein
MGAMPTVSIDLDSPIAGIITKRATQLELLKVKLETQNHMKLKSNWNRTEKEFQLGDRMMLTLQPVGLNLVVLSLLWYKGSRTVLIPNTTLRSEASGEPSLPQARIQVLWPVWNHRTNW